LLDPLHEVGDDFVRQFTFRRHLHPVLVSQSLDDQTLLRFAGHDRRSGVAALFPSVATVELQPRLQCLRIGRVAFVAMLDEYRPNSLLEEFDASWFIDR